MPKPLHTLAPGQHADFFAQLAEKTPRTTRDGKPLYNLKLRDRRRTVAAAVWADSPHFEECKLHWQPGTFFKVRGRYAEDDKYGPKVDIDQIRPVTDRDRADGFAEADFAEPPADAGAFAAVLALAAELADEPLRALVEGVFAAHADRLAELPGSARTYYPFPGGWAAHTRNVARHALWLADRYRDLHPGLTLNRDVVLAGALLHDVGRVAELDATSPLPKAGIDGELFGHLLLGVQLVRDAARAVPGLNPELLRLVEHVVYAHLRLPEWGSPKLPAIPEVLIVHHADDLDAKLEMYARCLGKDVGDGPFTERDPVLGRVLLKGRSV